MVHIPLWKRLLILAVVFFAVAYSAPNLLPKETVLWIKETMPSFVPHQTVNLGLDLQGGSHILLQVDLATMKKHRYDDLISELRAALRQGNIQYRPFVVTDQGVRVILRNPADLQALQDIIRGIDSSLQVVSSDAETQAGGVDISYGDVAIKAMQDQVVEQSIEIVRRRIDATGTNEPVIQKQGEDRIVVQLPGVDDPDRIKNLLGQTGVLSFHLVEDQQKVGSLVLPMMEDPNQKMPLHRQAILTGDMLVQAAFAQDQNGAPAVSFRFNPVGTRKFCDVSSQNVNHLFAIVLDGAIISAPVIREPICGGSGQISGSFTIKEANDLAILLRAGALPVPLHVVEERSVGPSLGADSVQGGKVAALVGFGFIFLLMCTSYGLFGFFSCLGMIVNLAFVFAVLSLLQATLTMPGIAGLVLTVCMSVDANVLIYERIREELRAGRSAISAIDQGFRNAMGTIMDANLTSLFAGVILFSFGTGPIKGFAITASVGVIASFFTALSVVRLMIVFWAGRRRLTGLPV